MQSSVFDYETKTFLSILAISLIGMSIVVSQYPISTDAVFAGQLFKKTPGDTFIVKDIDVGSYIGKDFPTLTKNELKSLADGSIITNAGKTDYSQYIILRKSGDKGFDGGSIIFGRDENAQAGHYLFFETNQPLFEYLLTFSSGLASRIENNKLVDLENKYLNIMGKSFVIVQTFVDTSKKILRLRLMGGEGIIDFEDKNYGDGAYESGVRVNNKQVDANLKMTAVSSNNRLVITEIRYAPLASTRKRGDIYVAPRQGLRGRLKDSQSMLVKSLELIYGGISGVQEARTSGGGEFILFEPKGRDQYDLSFRNELGISYDITLVSASGTFKYGPSSRDLVFIEGDSISDFNIDANDYFIVNNKDDLNGITNIVEYSGIDYDDSTIYFTDVGTNQKKSVAFDSATGLGYLTEFGNTYLFYVSSTSPHPIVVDQNIDGVIDGGEARIVLRGGGRLDLGSNNIIGGSSITLTLTTPKRLFAEPSSDEVVTFSITKSGNNLDISVPNQNSINMYRDNAGFDKGMTDFGVYFLRDVRGKTSSQLVIEYPRATVFAVPTASQGEAAVAVTLEREKYLRKQE